MAQWGHTGTLNAHVEETFTGHALVKAFGRQADVEERFDSENESLYQASFGAQLRNRFPDARETQLLIHGE